MLSTSASLLERLRKTPERMAWERFVDLYTPLLFAWANRMGVQSHEAADLVQDVFAVLVEKLPQFQYDSQKSFRAWLKTILLNRRRNQIRKKQVEKPAGDNAVLEAAADTPETAEFERDEYQRHLVARALDLMQAEFQGTTWKACWELVVKDRPAAEIAAELGVTVNAVYLAKSRVLRRLRQELAGLLD